METPSSMSTYMLNVIMVMMVSFGTTADCMDELSGSELSGELSLLQIRAEQHRQVSSQIDSLHSHDDQVFTCASFGWQPIGKGKKRRVIDGYAYNGESLIASARYEELKDYINGTAILITDANFHGKVKEPVNPPKIPKSEHVVLAASAFDECGDKKAAGFNYCALSVAKNGVAKPIERFDLDDDDWVIFSDPDEVPDREVVRLLHECDVPVGPGNKSDHLRLLAKSRRHYVYSFRCGYDRGYWVNSACTTDCKGPVVMRAGTMRTDGLMTFQAQEKPWCVEKGQYASCAAHLNKTTIEAGMWHLSSFGGPESFQKKIQDNSDKFSADEHPYLYARNCVDLNGEHGHPGMKLHRLPVDLKYPHVPHSVADAPERYSIFFDWNQGVNSTLAKLKQIRGQAEHKRNESQVESQSTYSFYNLKLLTKEHDDLDLVNQLRSDADGALANGPWRVTDNIFAKGDKFDRVRFKEMARNTTILSLAYKAFGELEYCSKAAENFEAFYTEPGGLTKRMDKTQFDSARKGTFPFDIMGWKDHYYLLDAAQMVQGCFKDGQYARLKSWASNLTQWLQASPMRKEVHEKVANNHGSWYDAFVLSFMHFVGDEDGAKLFKGAVGNVIRERINGRNGLLLKEGRAKRDSVLDQLFGLQGLVILAHVADVGLQPEVQTRLKLALSTVLPKLPAYLSRRFVQLTLMAASLYRDNLGQQGVSFEDAGAFNPLFEDEAGIAPYWQFALKR